MGRNLCSYPSSHPYKEVAPVFDNSPKFDPGHRTGRIRCCHPQRTTGEWLFDDNDTASTIVDTSQQLQWNQCQWSLSEDTPRGTGTSLDFSGGNNYAWVSAGTNETTFSFDQTGDAFTVALWTKRLPQYDWRGLVVKNGENNGGWKLSKSNSANLYLFTDETTGEDRPTTRAEHNMSTIQRRHVAAVHGYQGSKQRLYVDGVLDKESTRGGKIASSNGRVLAFGVGIMARLTVRSMLTTMQKPILTKFAFITGLWNRMRSLPCLSSPTNWLRM